jgi:hypothetical protein
MSDTISVPAVLRSFADPSGLLPGEDRQDFEAIRQMMIDDIKPETNLEWLWVFDLVELSWEILRYRRLKQKDPAGFSRTGNRSGFAAIRRCRDARICTAKHAPANQAERRGMAGGARRSERSKPGWNDIELTWSR